MSYLFEKHASLAFRWCLKQDGDEGYERGSCSSSILLTYLLLSSPLLPPCMGGGLTPFPDASAVECQG